MAKAKAKMKRANAHNLALCSLDIIIGAENIATLSPRDLFDRERPDDFTAMFKLSRDWHRQNWFIEQVNLLKTAFYNYGLRIQAAEKKGRNKVKDWLEDPDRREALVRYDKYPNTKT